ncbi:phosphomannomutase, partial [Psychrobacter sp. Ps5]|nr:phosphomannomutase [Psychrobacter sp. Ps5]
LPVGTKLSCIDGVRLDFARGFGVLRQSNTSQNLTVRFAGDSIDDLIDIQTRFAALCRPFNKTLAMQILAIVAE